MAKLSDDYSARALGAAIRSEREKKRPKLTQQALGEAAGYRPGAGAGVTISRVESGQVSPGGQRLERVARALELSTESLINKAERLTADDEPGGGERAEPKRPPRERLKGVQERVDERTEVITEVGEAFNDAHERAKDGFFLRFVEIAVQIQGAPEPPQPDALSDEDNADPEAQARHRIRVGSSVVGQAVGGVGGAAAGGAVGGATAYATFMAAAAFGSASTGTAIAGLSGVAATNATLALLGGGTLAAGGAGVMGGTMLLAGLVAAPAAIAAVGGIVWMRRRSKRQEAELSAQLDEAEAELDRTERGFQGLVTILKAAAETLDYIGVHAAHAVKRWNAQLGEQPLDWTDMEPGQHESYETFVEICGCQLAVASLNTGAFLTTDGPDLDTLFEQTHEVVTIADREVKKLV